MTRADWLFWVLVLAITLSLKLNVNMRYDHCEAWVSVRWIEREQPVDVQSERTMDDIDMIVNYGEPAQTIHAER